MVKKIINHLKLNWITYGFETFTIIAGILGAFTLNNWNESRKQHKSDIEFLKNLKIELVNDTTVLSRRYSTYIEINNVLNKTLHLFENPVQLTDSDRWLISHSLINLEVLTPIYKNISRNDIVIAAGALTRIDVNLNREYLEYIEKTKSNNDIISKFGETLQTIVIQDVHPLVDLNYQDISGEMINFDFEKIRNNRLIKNALKKSIFFRNVYINWINGQIEQAEKLLAIINGYLTHEK
ncbi:MAG TPA: DUF6090 family protein [Draconibacterium sp.]|nr:DUF6090 family protein [Draconibacterium sp.]